MKIRSVRANAHRRGFEVRTSKGRLYFPWAKAHPRPTSEDPVVTVAADSEIGKEGFSYVLASGKEGTIHIEQVLEYNQDPVFLRDGLLYKLTLEAQERVRKSPLSKREIVRRLGTSASQLYRLLDQTNRRKSVDQMLLLLHVLDCDVRLSFKTKSA